jgi:hypothetical protein
MPFNSVEDLNQKNQILLYIWAKIPSEEDIKYTNLINKNVDWIYIVSNENIVVQNKTFTDVSTTVIFPNILWVRTYRSVLILCVIVFMLASWYLVYKKEVIKL